MYKNRIIVNDIEITNNRARYIYTVSSNISDYFHPNVEYWIQYDFSLTTIPKSVLIIPFLCNVLPISWLLDAEIICDEVDEDFFNCVNEIKQSYKSIYENIDLCGKLSPTKIRKNSSEKRVHSSASFYSGGVDAIYSALSHMEEKPLLISVLGVDIRINDTGSWNKVESENFDFANRIGVPFCTVKSSFRDAVNEGQLSKYVQNYNKKYNYYTNFQFGISTLALAAPICAYYGMKKVYFPSGWSSAKDFGIDAGAECIISKVKFADSEAICDGDEKDRQDKVVAITEFHKRNDKEIQLRVCWKSNTGENCCKCEKCLRTIAGIKLTGENPIDYGFKNIVEMDTIIDFVKQSKTISGQWEPAWRYSFQVENKNALLFRSIQLDSWKRDGNDLVNPLFTTEIYEGNKVVFLGDIVCSYWDYLYNNNYELWFSKIKSMCKGADWVITNLETPIAGERLGYTNNMYSFNTPDTLLDAMKASGINFISTANNHCLDRGLEGLFETIKALDNLEIHHTGTFINKNEKPFSILTVGNKRLGILAITYGTNAQENKCYIRRNKRWCVNLLQNQEISELFPKLFWNTKAKMRYGLRKVNCGRAAHDRIEDNRYWRQYLEKSILEMKKNCDYSIVLMHAGSQFKNKPSERTIEWMNWLKKNNVDLVVGNHEHVPLSIFKDGQTLGFYSLGDLTSTYGVTQEPYGKYAEASVVINMYINDSMKFTFSPITIVEENGNYIPICLYDAYNQSNGTEKEYYYWLNLRVYNRVTKNNYTRLEVRREYPIDHSGNDLIVQAEQKLNKDTQLFHMTRRWLEIKQKGKSIVAFFKFHKVGKIAVYGASVMGERLFDELEDSGVKIEYFLDRNKQKRVQNVETIHPSEAAVHVDMIVVTAISYFEEIEEQLRNYEHFRFVPIVSLDEIVKDTWIIER